MRDHYDGDANVPGQKTWPPLPGRLGGEAERRTGKGRAHPGSGSGAFDLHDQGDRLPDRGGEPRLSEVNKN